MDRLQPAVRLLAACTMSACLLLNQQAAASGPVKEGLAQKCQCSRVNHRICVTLVCPGPLRRMYVREVQKTLVLAGVETEGSAHHQRLVSLVESHRAVMVIFMQVRRMATLLFFLLLVFFGVARAAAAYLHDPLQCATATL